MVVAAVCEATISAVAVLVAAVSVAVLEAAVSAAVLEAAVSAAVLAAAAVQVEAPAVEALPTGIHIKKQI